MGVTRKLTALAVTGVMALGLSACSAGGDGGSGGGGGEDGYVGVSMPTRSLERWNNDGANLQSQLEEQGYRTDLQYADNDTDQQISQIQNMVADGVDVLVVAAIDGTVLGPVLAEAAGQDITVIAYDRLINETPNVDYYATFDNYLVGQMQGQFIEETLGLADGAGPFNFEPFAGSPDDNNALFFFNGAWDVLSPYVDSGQLVIRSGKDTTVESLGILGWGSDDAQAEMENRLQSFYSDGERVDAVLSPNDSLALGIQQALVGAGYTAGDGWPTITGQDADLANVQAIVAGQQSMTVWKDTRALADRVALMIGQILAGDEVEVNDTETYDNGELVVPSFLLEPVVVTADTVTSTLVDSGYYDASELNL